MLYYIHARRRGAPLTRAASVFKDLCPGQIKLPIPAQNLQKPHDPVQDDYGTSTGPVQHQ